MILPIVTYGHPVLRKKTTPIAKDYPNLEPLITDMFSTMENALGVGLSAPQVGLSIRLFVVDASPFLDKAKQFSPEERAAIKGFRKVFINPEILEEYGEPWAYNEGCLSIPNIFGDVSRNETVKLRYQDEHFETHTITLKGMLARIVQHEYDHLEGILFTDRISPLKRKLLRAKMLKISMGKASDIHYPIITYKKSRV